MSKSVSYHSNSVESLAELKSNQWYKVIKYTYFFFPFIVIHSPLKSGVLLYYINIEHYSIKSEYICQSLIISIVFSALSQQMNIHI